MAAGRPKKYTKKALEEAVDRYFAGISRTKTVLDDLGRPVKNDAGEQLRRIEYLEPPGIGGLCLYLGIDRSTWQNYADENCHPELKEICGKVRTRIEAYLERELLTREKSVQGVIFNLQNNYGWKQKQEVELGKQTRSSMERTEEMRIKDKLAVLKEALPALMEMEDEEEETRDGREET